jgi:preprotein translocase subunit SecA
MGLSSFLDKRYLKKLKKTAQKVMDLQETYEKLSDEELRSKTEEFKAALADGKKIDDIKIHAFATVREAAYRVLGMRHYFVQIIGGLALLDGDVAEMSTGEGKTLVAALPSYLRALEGKGVHVITSNEYLAKRDKEQIGQIHEFLGLTVGLNLSNMETSEKQKAYNADITYGVGNEFGFDYLRDHLVYDPTQRVQRPLYYAIIDEVDSILIDEARTPLIIAGKSQVQKSMYEHCNAIIQTLKKDKHYTVDIETRAAMFTEEGVEKIERILGIDNLYDLKHHQIHHHLLQALRANTVLKRNVDYIVEDDKIKLVDINTGRIMEGRSLSDGLHQALEAKEGVPITEENKTQSMITLQNFYRKYQILSGMSGTAKTEEREFRNLYGMNVVKVPTNKPRIRIDREDRVYLTKDAKYRAIVEKVKEEYKTGRPILIGTTSIENSLEVARYLDETDIPFEVLNAQTAEYEARLIATAGQEGSVMIATNMAGRGTDIILEEASKKAGGLLVIGTERHESRRIDNQLIGRAGRQGDPGETQFFISLEDDLFIRYGEEKIEKLKKKLKLGEDSLILNKNIHKITDSIQKVAEGINYATREYTTKLDNVLNDQRDAIYGLREQILESEDILDYAIEMLKSHLEYVVSIYCPINLSPEEWDIQALQKALKDILPEIEIQLPKEVDSVEDVFEFVKDYMNQYIEKLKEKNRNNLFIQLLRQRLLLIIDRLWADHIETMTQLKNGIFLRSYGQEDPLRAYQLEGYQAFREMETELHKEVAQLLAHLSNRIKIDGENIVVVGL